MKRIIRFNFISSVWLSILGGAVIIYEPSGTFPDPENILGPLRNNLLIIIGYFVISQILLWIFTYRKNGLLAAVVMGILFPLVAFGMHYYASIHFIPLNDILVYCMLYIGLSHFLFGYIGMRKVKSR